MAEPARGPQHAPERLTFDGAGVTIAADRWEASRPAGTVLLLHGGGQTRHSWARTAPRLARAGWTAIALDLRGHGDSGWSPDGDYTIDPFVADLDAVVAQLGESPVLVGASMGGITSLVAAGRNPGPPALARGLVLVDVVVSLERAGVQRIREFMTARPDGFETLQDAADAIAAYNPNRPRPPSAEGLRKNLRRREDGRWHWHWDPAFMRIDDEPRRRFPDAPLRAAAAAVTVPVLVVRGARSDVVSDAGIRDMLTLVPHAEVADVSTAGHMVAGDDNDVFAERLEGFLERVKESDGTPQA